MQNDEVPGMNELTRLAEVETNVAAQGRELGRMGQTLDSVAREMRSGFNDIRSNLEARGRAPWAVMAAWAAIVLTIGGLVGTGLFREFSRHDVDIIRLEGVTTETLLELGAQRERLTGAQNLMQRNHADALRAAADRFTKSQHVDYADRVASQIHQIETELRSQDQRMTQHHIGNAADIARIRAEIEELRRVVLINE